MYEEDRKLVGRMLAGDQRAFDAFFCAYADRLAAFAARRSNLTADGIEDLVQNSLIKAIRNIATFRGEAALFTWLCEICRHELANVLRHGARKPAHESLDDDRSASEELLELRAPADYEPHENSTWPRTVARSRRRSTACRSDMRVRWNGNTATASPLRRSRGCWG
jgi:RNA polymerase sigma-70 factor (ECF subfamily)